MESTLTISISSPDDLSQAALNDELRRVFLDLKEDLDGGTIDADEAEGRATKRSGIVELFRSFVVAGVNLGVFSAVFTVFKTWLESKPTCEVTLTYPDGTQIKISKVTLAEAERLHEAHLKKLAAAASTAS
jgi:hypothetical protein